MTKAPDVLRTHKLQLRTVTPVSIGADEADALSPYADYVIEGDAIVLLDKRKVEKAVLDAGLLDDYVIGIGDSMESNPNRSGFNLGLFIKEKLKKAPRDLALRIMPNRGIEQHRKQSVAAIVKEAGKAYLPGSSLKGAFRTAVLYDWLTATEKGSEELVKYKNALHSLELAAADVGRLKRIFEQKRLRSEFNAAKKHLRDQEKRFFVEDNLFGRLNDGPESRFLRFSDSSMAPDDAVGLYGIKRIRLQPNPKVVGRESEMPTPREALFSNSALTATLNIVPAFASDSVLKYWVDQSMDEVLGLLNQFTKDCISNELYELREADNRDFRKVIDQMEDFYVDLEDKAKNGGVFLRMGFGKTVYDNSLTLAMLNGLPGQDGENAFKSYRTNMLGVKGSARNYPVTRTVTADGLPLGWVEITL